MSHLKISFNHAFIYLFATSIASLLCITSNLSADVTGLTLSQPSVAACKDYFTSEWASPLDMNESGDILNNLVPREVHELSSYSYSNGVFSTTTTGLDPYFRILTWADNQRGTPVAIADDTTRFGINHPLEFARQGYRILSFRMYSSVAGDYQVLWEKSDGSFGQTDAFKTYPGWHVYSLDLATAALSAGSGDSAWTSGKVVGIRIDPIRNVSGASIKLDWVQLTPDSGACGNVVANYSSSNQDLVKLFLDDNFDPLDGVFAQSSILNFGSGSNSFTTTSIFPSTYNLYAVGSKDYATLNLAPWDMDDSATDVDSSKIYNIDLSGNGFGSSSFCGTSNADDANFHMKLPFGRTIDAATFNKLSISLKTNSNDILAVFFEGSGGSGATTVSTSGTGSYNTYQIDMSGVANWTGQISDLRINPVHQNDGTARTAFCVDWITLGSSFLLSEPSIPAVFNASQQPQVLDRPVASFVQPDKEGGEDFFVAVRGKPSDMSSVSDIQHVDNISEAWIYPGNAYVDSGGATKIGDFFQATSRQGSDDPTNFSVFLDNSRTIDPEKYKIACFTLDVLAPTDIYHSVARILWQRDSVNINGDDLVLKTTGESRYCLRMDTLQVEPIVAPGPDHPWRKNTDGSGINYWRIDAHEETNATTFRFQDIRLAADHQADDKFLLVISGSRNKDVTAYYSGRSDGTQGTAIGTLTSGRNTDTLLWNTSGVPEGRWYVYLTVGSETYLAPGSVIIKHGVNPDSANPILSVDAPLLNHSFSDSLEIAGFALDNVRIATIEVFLDGQIISTFLPSQFRKAARDAYPGYPFSSSSGFQNFISIPPSFGLGTHTVTINAYDTVGNLTQYTSQVLKVSTGTTTPISYPVPDDARVAVPIQAPVQPTAIPTALPALTLSAKVSGVNLTFNVGQLVGCSNLELLGNVAPNKDKAKLEANSPQILFSASPGSDAQIKFSAKNLKSLKISNKKTDTGIYVLARCNGARHSAVVKIDAKKIKKSKSGQAANVKSLLKSIKSKLKKG